MFDVLLVHHTVRGEHGLLNLFDNHLRNESKMGAIPQARSCV